MAKVIEETQRPAIILAPNKTLAAQLYGEFKGFFSPTTPSNISCPTMTTINRGLCRALGHFIEKESQINEQIDRMRHSATRACWNATT